LDNAIYVTTKSVINNLIAEFLSDKPGDVSAFFEFTRHKDSSAFVSPQIFTLLTKLLENYEETFSQINSLIEDGGFVIGKADFGNESEDVVVLANGISLTRPYKKVFIIKSKTESIVSKTKLFDNITILDVEAIVADIKNYDIEFRKLYWGT